MLSRAARASRCTPTACQGYSDLVSVLSIFTCIFLGNVTVQLHENESLFT